MEIIIEPFTGLKWKGGDKLSGSRRSKSTMEDRDRDLFKGRFYMNVEIMWRASCVHQGVTSGTFEQRGIMRGGGF
ncbi:MAG: hypothetical protein WBB08_11160 [Halobacteriota archaeon]